MAHAERTPLVGGSTQRALVHTFGVAPYIVRTAYPLSMQSPPYASFEQAREQALTAARSVPSEHRWCRIRIVDSKQREIIGMSAASWIAEGDTR